MTIDRAIAMLKEIDKSSVNDAAKTVMGKVGAGNGNFGDGLYTQSLSNIGLGVVKKYHPNNADEIWQMLGGRPWATQLGMKFTGLLKGGGGSTGTMNEYIKSKPHPPGGSNYSWEEWWDMSPEERLGGLSYKVIEDWIDMGFKDITNADESILENQGNRGLAKRISAIISGTSKSPNPHPELFNTTNAENNLADFAGVYDKKPGADFDKLINEIKAAWVHFMVNDPAGVVKMLTKALQEEINNRISSA